MDRRQLLSGLSLALVAGTSASAAPGKTPAGSKRAAAETLDTLGADFISSGYGVGLSVAAIRDGKLVLAKAFGKANLEDGAPVTAATVFRAGSITKQFVGAAVVRLADAGRIDLDAPAAKYIPEMAGVGPITVRMLLHQSAGLRNYSDREFAQLQRLDRTPDELLAYILKQPELARFPPGDRFEYSNSNYFILGVIVERAGGQPLEATLNDLARLAGLTQTAPDHAFDVVPHRAEGYALIEGKPGRFRKAEFLSMANAGGAGVLRSTPTDLAKWHQALFSGRVLPEASFRRMLETGTLNNGKPVLRDDPPIMPGQPAYGFGLEIGVFDGRKAVGHGGSVPGFTAYVVTFPDEDLSMAIMMNIDPNRQMPFAAVQRAVLAKSILSAKP